MVKLLIFGAVAAAAVYWIRSRRPASPVDRLKDAVSEAGDKIADAASVARSAAEEAAERIREATTRS